MPELVIIPCRGLPQSESPRTGKLRSSVQTRAQAPPWRPMSAPAPVACVPFRGTRRRGAGTRHVQAPGRCGRRSRRPSRHELSNEGVLAGLLAAAVHVRAGSRRCFGIRLESLGGCRAKSGQLGRQRAFCPSRRWRAKPGRAAPSRWPCGWAIDRDRLDAPARAPPRRMPPDRPTTERCRRSPASSLRMRGAGRPSDRRTPLRGQAGLVRMNRDLVRRPGSRAARRESRPTRPIRAPPPRAGGARRPSRPETPAPVPAAGSAGAP